MLSSIATVSLSGTLDSKLRAIARARFEGVEIFENDLLTYGGSARDVRALLGELGLRCTAFQPFRDFEGMPGPLRARVFDRLERKFDLMQELGAALLLVCSNVSLVSSGERQRTVDDFRELGERAQARGLRVGYEALAWGRHISDHRDAWSVVREVDHPAVGLILDTFHSLAREVPLDSLRDIDPAKVFLVQVADAPLLKTDVLSWSRHFRNMPGQGDFPLIDYVAALVESGYEGPLSLEIFNDSFRASSTLTVAVDGRRSLLCLCDQVARKLRREPEQVLPPRVRCRGVDFIEFAANEAEVGDLSRLFTALGFSMVGRHRNKDVTRWRQHDINFVVNTEPESFARAYDDLHGASVCAIGLRVDDVEAAIERAHALQIESFSQPLGVGELRIPCVRGIGGSLIYFIEAGKEEYIWQNEFVSLPAEGEHRDAGLLRVDHIAQTLPYDDMPSWLLYYLALFDVTKTPRVEVADPFGLVYSQSVESAGAQLRLVLNSSASAQTLAARFLHNYLGAGVQYMTLATQDIFATARQLRENGLEILPIPHNYYDDLQARFGLDVDLAVRLAEHNVLYDADESGEYFQLYSRAFAKRFFFEIVERRNYGGYGHANASIRLAAQSRYKQDTTV